MKIDMFTRAMLAIIALALTVIAVRPLLAPTQSYAGRKIDYKLVRFLPSMVGARLGIEVQRSPRSSSSSRLAVPGGVIRGRVG